MGINLAAAWPRPHEARRLCGLPAGGSRPPTVSRRTRSRQGHDLHPHAADRATRCGKRAGQGRAEGTSRRFGISLPFCAERS